ncbi:MAG: hydantoinase B/oxoprolinase family protein [Actinomycetota bacterium]|nr:hydantoinase B/oxoprolinase family protein [Actinomycetota bacterium]
MNKQEIKTEEGFDPILAAVLANRFEAIVREMMNTLFRAGRSSVLNMARDFSCCVVTADDQLLAAAEGLQVHVLGAGFQTASMRELHDLQEGDAFLHNDPFLGNTHTADHTLLVPVFAGGEHVFTVSAKAHQADCGNSLPTTYMPNPVDLYEEGGLNFPCVRVQKDYEDVDDIIRMCQRRIRVPEVWYGDYLASLGAVRIGERRVKELIDEYGVGVVREFQTWWLDYSERRMAQAVSELPAAQIEADSNHDPLPGLPDGVKVNVKIGIDPAAEKIEVDLRDNVDCVPAGINLSQSCATAGAVIAVFNCIDADVPRNAGSFRRIEVMIREGSVAGGLKFPFSSSMSTTNVLNRLINAAQSAFSQLGDGFGLAEGGGALGVGWGVYSGIDNRKDQAYINQAVIGNNGGPAGPVCDGWVTYAMPDCAKTVYIDSVEIIEQKYPLRFGAVRLLTDSGGAGRYRGGPASEVIYGPADDNEMQVFYAADFADEAPKGVLGGLPGRSAEAAKLDPDGTETVLPPMGGADLSPGQSIRGIEAGGGGYGDPLERDPQMVVTDLLEGWVSAEAAETIYGVVTSGRSGDGSLTPDLAATADLRTRLRSSRTPTSHVSNDNPNGKA